MESPPHVTQPGVFIDIICNIDGNIVHPEKESFDVFRPDNRKRWGVSVWCNVPSDLEDSKITISVKVRDLKRWCGLTTGDITVSKFYFATEDTYYGGDPVAANKTLDPEVVPICNEPPLFTEGESTIRYVLEQTPPNVAIGFPVSATDADGDILEYTMSGTDASSFSIDSDSGQLRTKDPLDYETKNIYSVLVSVSDTKDGKDEITVTINVTDDNEAPIFTEGTTTARNVPENTLPNVAIGAPVTATDENDDTLEYALTGTEASSFSIDSGSGQIKTSSPLNYEVKDTYSVSVIVTDNKGGTDEIAVTINVTDANDAPIFTDGTMTTRSVAENLSFGATVGIPVIAEDEDDDTLEYSLSGTDASSFNINSSSAQITTNALFNYEIKDTYSVTVSVTDNNGGTDEIAVTINVTDENDAPIFTEGTGTTRSVAENLASGAVVGTPVLATDEDDDTLEYSLSGTDASSFNINSSTGQITSNEKFNYEVKDIYSVTVTADDNNGGTDEIAVTINVTDENDTPIFTEGFFVSRSVAENSAIGTEVGAPVLATDEDGDTLEYSITSINTDFFNIDDSSAQLSTKTLLNHEERSSYSVTLSVTDNNGGINATFVTITVSDENDAPIFNEGTETKRAIIESAASGTNIGEPIAATDEDGDTLTYSLSGTDASSFSFNTSTGQLTTNSTLDYDVQSSYAVTVSVTDNNGGTDEITVEIEVLEFYISKQEFFEIHYAIRYWDEELIMNDESGTYAVGDIDVQTFTIRGYGYDNGNPIYVENYYKFEGGSSTQTTTGWESNKDEASISTVLDEYKKEYSEDSGYVHDSMTVSVHDRTADEARVIIYKTICNAASDFGTYTVGEVSITYPINEDNTSNDILDNNTSNDILDIDTLLLYLYDDDCDPTN